MNTMRWLLLATCALAMDIPLRKVRWHIPGRRRLGDEVAGAYLIAHDISESVELDNAVSSYVGDVIIGGATPDKGQNMTLVFDTGSSDVWVTDSDAKCDLSGGTGACLSKCNDPRNPYPCWDNSRADSTRSTVTESHKLTYGGTAVHSTMEVATDYLHIPTVGKQCSVPNFPVGVATELSQNMHAIPGVGIFGLAFKPLMHFSGDFAPLKRVTKECHGNVDPVMGWYLTHSSGSPAAEGSLLTIGGINSELIKHGSEFANIPTCALTVCGTQLRCGSLQWWSIALHGMEINHVKFDPRPRDPSPYPAIVDSGSTSIAMPAEAVERAIAVITDYVMDPDNIPCQSDSDDCKGPDITFHLSGYTIVISDEDYMFCRNSFVTETNGQPRKFSLYRLARGLQPKSCFGFGAVHDNIILGDAIQRRYYTVYKGGNNAVVSFACGKEDGANPEHCKEPVPNNYTNPPRHSAADKHGCVSGGEMYAEDNTTSSTLETLEYVAIGAGALALILVTLACLTPKPKPVNQFALQPAKNVDLL